MPKTATVRARLEPDLKREVEQILNRLGLTASEAILLLYRQIKLQRALPFTVRIPGDPAAKGSDLRRPGKTAKRSGSRKKHSAD